MLWWVWVLSGLGLLALELITIGGFYLFFCGLAALAVGAAVGGGILESVWPQWLLFSVLSITSLLLFRGPLLARMQSRNRDVGTLVGEVAVLLEDLSVGASGKAELRGTTWTVQSAEGRALLRGQRCRVERVDGLTLWLRAD